MSTQLSASVTRISVPVLLLAAAATSAAVAAAVTVGADDWPTTLQREASTSQPTGTATHDPMQAYVDTLVERHRQYVKSVAQR
jgi:hypothetical protein